MQRLFPIAQADPGGSAGAEFPWIENCCVSLGRRNRRL